MAWIESHDTLAEHPKTLRFARLIKTELPAVIGHLHLLWWWCLKYADDGNLSEYEPAEIAAAAKWTGDADLFVSSLVRVGFIEQPGEGELYVHDWYEYAGKLIEMRKANAERMRQKRAAHKPSESNEGAAHVQRTYDARTGATVPNQTKPIESIQEESILPPPEPIAADAADTESEQPSNIRTMQAPKTPAAVSGFNYGEMWELIEADVGERITWNRNKEGRAVKNLLAHHQDATPADFAAFLRYKRQTFRGDPNGEVTFTRYYEDFGAWWRAGKPEKLERTTTNGREHQPDALTRKLRDIAATVGGFADDDADADADRNVLNLRARPATERGGAASNGKSLGAGTRPGA